MHAIKGGWVGQTFALAKSIDSGGKKSRIRRSKEERKGMVESFIKKYQSLNNGNFPSLNLTHKEVGGSFYTVREIVREIIQENRVLGPGKLPLEEQYNDLFVEQYPLGTISTEPQTSLSISPNGSPEHDQHESSGEALDLISEQHAEPEQQGFNNGKIINGSHVIVKNEEADKPKVVEVQVTEPLETEKRMEGVAASRAKVTQMADLMVETFPLPPATKSAGNLNGNSSNVREVNGILEEKDVEKVLLEPEQDPENKSAGNLNGNSSNVREVNGILEEKDVEKVLLEPEQDPENKSAGNLNGNSSNVREVNGILEEKDVEKVLLEPEQDPENGISLPDGMSSLHNSSLVDDNEVSLHGSSLVDDKEVEKPAVPLLERSSDLACEKAVENLVVLAMGSSNASVTDEGIVQDAEADIDVKVKSSHDEKAVAETKVIDAQNGIQAKSSTVGSQSIAKEVEMKDEASFQHSQDSQKQSSPTLNRINLESWGGGASKNRPEPETNPLLAIFKSFLAALVKFWSE